MHSNQRQRESFLAGIAAFNAGEARPTQSALYDLRAMRAGWDDAEHGAIDCDTPTIDVALPTRAATPKEVQHIALENILNVLQGLSAQHRFDRTSTLARYAGMHVAIHYTYEGLRSQGDEITVLGDYEELSVRRDGRLSTIEPV